MLGFGLRVITILTLLFVALTILGYTTYNISNFQIVLIFIILGLLWTTGVFFYWFIEILMTMEKIYKKYKTDIQTTVIVLNQYLTIHKQSTIKLFLSASYNDESLTPKTVLMEFGQMINEFKSKHGV